MKATVMTHDDNWGGRARIGMFIVIPSVSICLKKRRFWRLEREKVMLEIGYKKTASLKQKLFCE